MVLVCNLRMWEVEARRKDNRFWASLDYTVGPTSTITKTHKPTIKHPQGKAIFQWLCLPGF